MSQNVLAVILAIALAVPISLLAWNAKRAIEQNDRAAQAIQDAAIKMAEFKGDVKNSIDNLRTILTGSDGQNGMRGELSAVRKRLDAQIDVQNERLGEWTVWRAVTDGRLEQLETVTESISPTPPFRRVRRKSDKANSA